MKYSIEYTNTKGVINNNPILFVEEDLPINLNPLFHPNLDFVGWLDINENIVTQIKNVGNMNLYALWKEKENFVVMFEENANSDLVTNMPDNVTVNVGEDLIISNQIPIRKGYEFINWNTNKEDTGIKFNPNDKISKIIENKVLYAIWKAQTVKSNLLKYDGNSLGVTNLPDDLKFNSGEIVTISNLIPKKENSVFLNWNTKNDNSGDIIYPNQSLKLEEDNILYANWLDLVGIVTIEFDGNGSNVSNVPAPIAVNVGDNITISKEIPIREGYKFINWNSNKDGSGVSVNPGEEIKNIKESEDYFAQWEEDTKMVTIEFDGNGSNVSNLPAPISVNVGDDVIISNEIPIKDCYVFLNWNTKKDNSGEKIYPNQELKNVEKNIILYAIFKKIIIINCYNEYKCICCGCKKKLNEICDCNKCC